MFESATAAATTMLIRIDTEVPTIIAVESIAIGITATGAGIIINWVEKRNFPAGRLRERT